MAPPAAPDRRSLFCLLPWRLAFAAPHMPPSGSQAESSFLNGIYRHAAPSGCFAGLRLGVEERGPGPSASLSRTAAAESRLSQPLSAPSDFPGKFPPPWPVFTALRCFLSCSKPSHNLYPLGCSPYSSGPRHSQISGGEEVVHFTLKHSVMVDTCHKVHVS